MSAKLLAVVAKYRALTKIYHSYNIESEGVYEKQIKINYLLASTISSYTVQFQHNLLDCEKND